MPIISSVAELQEYITVGNDLQFKSIKPCVFNAEKKYLKPILGSALFKALEEGGDSGELMQLVQNVVAKFTLWLYVVPGGVQVDDAGIYQSKTADMWRLTESEIQTYRLSALEDAMDAMDLMIANLEENAKAAAADKPTAEYTPYELWYVSPTRQRYAGLLINNGDDFSEYVALYRSSLTFLMMCDCIRDAELHIIAPLLGDYYNTQKQLTGLGNSDLVLRRLILETLAKLAAAAALSKGLYYLNAGRITMTFQPEPIADKVLSSYKTSAQDALERLQAKLEQLKPAGYVPRSSSEDVLRRQGAKIVIA
ncbi:DUF6712 family protein [Runella zeae]|uniref:DUF6712 family protein n=1 Tax=Runella zeae TaxID=94255 RepID=UPI002353B9E3|nr:DUF6712 family protein [Runella zeae]